ncbi:MAG: 30S ribosome-binding factor RbfA [bacterium]|nr:30S ribosome-binding factor RbfA [bacterium]
MAVRRRGFERGERLGELLREILAEELTRIDDDRLGLVTITGVDVDRDLAFADVYFSTVDLDPETEAAAAEILQRHRRRLQSAVGRQAHVRRVPSLRFHSDEGMHAGARVEEILRNLRSEAGRAPEPPQDPAGGDTAEQ